MSTTQLISKNEPSKDFFQFLGRKTLWNRSASYLGNNIIMSNSKSQRQSRWEPAYMKTFTPLPVSCIPDGIDVNEFENLLRKQRLNDISRRLAMNTFEDDDPDLRSPSPEPIYDSKTGKRLNTRLVLNREKYMKEKNDIIGELILYDKNYNPPSDYKPPKKVKILYIKNNDKYNFTKYIIGPRGDNQKKLEEQSHCKITIRGRGSNWNSNSSYQKSYKDEQEPLHVYIQADTEEDLEKGEKMILPLLDENSEEYKKMKMALTVNYNSNEPACEFCGERGHKSWACPMNIGQFSKVEIKCKYCGDKGHPSCDCPFKPSDEKEPKNEMEKELHQFLKEIDTFTEQKNVPILEPERKANDIRKSVLLTGKINTSAATDKKESKSNVINDTKKADQPHPMPTMSTKIHQTYPTPNLGIYPNNSLYQSYLQTLLPYQLGMKSLVAPTPIIRPTPPMVIPNPNVKSSAPVQYNYVPYNSLLYQQGKLYPNAKNQFKNYEQFFPNYQSVSYTNSSGNKMPGFTSGKMTSIENNSKKLKKTVNESSKVMTYEEMLVKANEEKKKKEESNNSKETDEDDIKIEEVKD